MRTGRASSDRRPRPDRRGSSPSSKPGMNFSSRSSSPAAIVACVATMSICSRSGSRVSRARSAGQRPAGSTERSPTVTTMCRSGRPGATSSSCRPQRVLVDGAGRVAPRLVAAKRGREKRRLLRSSRVGAAIVLGIALADRARAPARSRRPTNRAAADRRRARASRRAAPRAAGTAAPLRTPRRRAPRH